MSSICMALLSIILTVAHMKRFEFVRLSEVVRFRPLALKGRMRDD